MMAIGRMRKLHETCANWAWALIKYYDKNDLRHTDLL